MKGSIRIEPATTLNELVVADQRFLPVFTRLGLDSCCGGSVTLREAAQHHGLDLDALLAELRRT
ncbi:MAG: hypothetical protein EPO26_19370 [Chloroflexota bacterium]|nr:MAG: hypothetical protein EPO26_19370 [Chloroflexota bacterium]